MKFNVKKSLKLQEEQQQKEIQEFLKELQQLSLEHNIWQKAIITPEGPQIVFSRLSEEELKKFVASQNVTNKPIQGPAVKAPKLEI